MAKVVGCAIVAAALSGDEGPGNLLEIGKLPVRGGAVDLPCVHIAGAFNIACLEQIKNGPALVFAGGRTM